MRKIKGIANQIVKELAERTITLSQGRNAACFGFVDEEGYISSYCDIVDGGLGGIPIRLLFGKISTLEMEPLLTGMFSLPENVVLISTKPGKTGVITDVSSVSFFDMPIVRIGVKKNRVAGVGIVYPSQEWFNLASQAENAEIYILKAETMEEELEMLRELVNIDTRFLEVGEELAIVEREVVKVDSLLTSNKIPNHGWARNVKVIDRDFARELVERSLKVGQGREVAAMGIADSDGFVRRAGEIVEGGIGFVPSRLLASSYGEMTGLSLRKAYTELIPQKAVIVHTHPGGTGVMHQGDASAGPSTWGRPIIAVGHDPNGKIKGATVIEVSRKLFALDDEYERLSLAFYDAQSMEEEVKVRNQRFEVAQQYTNLCKTIEIM